MSRELDARVAREVMGLTMLPELPKSSIPGADHFDILYVWPKDENDKSKVGVLPPYSTDMNAAMEVVEKVHRWFKLISAHGSWFATFYLGNPDYEPCEADTPAICLAALEAVKGDNRD